jgi:hypothetical protein
MRVMITTWGSTGDLAPRRILFGYVKPATGRGCSSNKRAHQRSGSPDLCVTTTFAVAARVAT